MSSIQVPEEIFHIPRSSLFLPCLPQPPEWLTTPTPHPSPQSPKQSEHIKPAIIVELPSVAVFIPEIVDLTSCVSRPQPRKQFEATRDKYSVGTINKTVAQYSITSAQHITLRNLPLENYWRTHLVTQSMVRGLFDRITVNLLEHSQNWNKCWIESPEMDALRSVCGSACEEVWNFPAEILVPSCDRG